ncbi:MAG TPA: hypothetical protein VFG95_04010, partial [Nitrospiria bacterium]|nr:hypothetical protein [Nitrospiria bacterium]
LFSPRHAVTRRTLDQIYIAGYSLLLVGTILIPVSNWVGGSLFYGAIALIMLAAWLSSHRRS